MKEKEWKLQLKNRRLEIMRPCDTYKRVNGVVRRK